MKRTRDPPNWIKDWKRIANGEHRDALEAMLRHRESVLRSERRELGTRDEQDLAEIEEYREIQELYRLLREYDSDED